MTDELTIEEAVHQIMVAGSSEVSEFKDDVIALRKECSALKKEKLNTSNF